MNWEEAGTLLDQLTEAYTGDNLRQITFCREIFPLKLKYDNGERTESLYQSIRRADQKLMKDIWNTDMNVSRGFFINSMVKPEYADVLNIVGKQRDNWDRIFSLLKDILKLKVSLGFYGAMEGWVVEFNKAGKRKVVLVPDKDNFKVSIPEVGRICFDMNEVDDVTRLYPLIHQYVKPIPDSLVLNTQY